MSVNLSPLGGAGAQFFTNDGVPLSGGLLYTYLAGTSTPATTYTSSNGITALANPIILDAAGRVPTGEIWLTDGISYKFVLKDSTGALIATWDGLSGINSNFIAFTAQEETATATAGQTVFNTTINYIPATNNLAVFVNGSNQIVDVNYTETDSNTVTFLTGLNVGDVVKFNTATPVATNATSAANVSYTPAGVGAATTSVQTKLREYVSVTDFGATGDGVTDDATAIQAAVTAAAGTKLFFPAGTYLIGTTINLVSDVFIDFGQASIIIKATDWGFLGTSITGTTLSGGSFTPDPSIVNSVHPTGTYGATCVAEYLGCTNCHVTKIVSASNFIGVLNFYNSSDCSATYNYATDNAGGIQCLASANYTGSSTVKGVDFSHNVIEHSGDDAFSFLIDAIYAGNISGSRIAFNHITKDIGAKGTIGQARGIALVGGVTSGTDNIYNVEVIGNTGYYMGYEFIRATGVLSSSISHNAVDGYSAIGYYAYTLGSTLTGAYGVKNIDFIGNKAINNLTNVSAIFTDGAEDCKIYGNYAVTTVGGQGALLMTNSSYCIIRDNTLENSLAFGIQLASTTTYCDCYSNNVTTAVAGISDNGTDNYKENNIGWETSASGNPAIGAAATSVTVTIPSNCLTAARMKVLVSPNTPLYSASQFYVTVLSATQFSITLNTVPGTNVFFYYSLYEGRT